MHRISECKILPTTLSDHSPLLIEWHLGQKNLSKCWRLNTSLLNNPDFVQFVKTEYLEFNSHQETSPLILWDCAKAYLRGRIIAFCSAKKKEKESEHKRLESKIKDLEQQHKIAQSPDLLKSLMEARRLLDSLLTDKAERCLRFTRQRYYEHGARATRLLAFQLRKQQSSRVVTKIKSSTPPKMLTDPVEISEAFANFYKSLYTNSGVSTCENEIKKLK